MTPDSTRNCAGNGGHGELAHRLAQLSDAEDFLVFFGVPYEQPVVDVNRLHILKRFQQYLRAERGLAELDDLAMFRRYRDLLVRAYGDFVRSTPALEKVFKVFQDADGQRVSVAALQATLAARRDTALAPAASNG
jgi:nitrogenase-stabilizing/protective protein